MSTIGIDVVRRSTVATGEARHRAFNGTIRLTSGEILVFYREGSDHWVTDDGVVKMVRSSDDGESWSDPETVFSLPDMSSGAHHGPAQLSDGRIILPMTLIKEIHKRDFSGHNRSDTVIISSSDGGRSWTSPTKIGPMEGWAWQNNYGRVHVLPDGRVFVPGGGQKLGEEPWYSGYFVSHDGGRTFPDRVTVAHGLADEIDLAPLGNGRWIAMVRDLRPPHYLHRSYSEDDGRTWSSPVSSGVLGHCPSLLVLPSGTILLGHRQVDRARPGGCALSASTDNGASWQHVSDIYVAPNDIRDCSYPSMVLLDDGRVFCSYYTEFADGNSDIEGVIFEVME
jgi:hypothetical protein